MFNKAEPGEVHWKYETSGWVRSSPTVDSNTVFVGNTSGRVHAIDTSTGQNQWKAHLPNGAIKASPTIDSDHVYACNNYGYVAALDRATGTEAWSVSIDGGYTLGGLNSSPLLYQQTLYVGMHDGKLYAIDVASGEMQWAFQTGSPIKTSPIAVDGKICIGSGKDLYAISASDGREQWVVTEPTDAVKTPTEHDGTLYFGSEDATVYAVEGADGTVEWANDRYYQHESTPTVYEDSLYIGLARGPNGIAKLDTDTGEEQWVSGSGNVFGSPTVADGTVFFCNNLGNMYAVDLESEEFEWTFRSESRERIRSSPTVVDGVLYVGSDDGALYALNAGTDTSSEGSRTEDRSFGYHMQVGTLTDQNASPDAHQEITEQPTESPTAGTETESPTAGTETGTTTPGSSNGDSEGVSSWVLGAGGSSVALIGYLFGKKALDGEAEPDESGAKMPTEENKTETQATDNDIELSEDGTLDLEEPDD